MMYILYCLLHLCGHK